MPFTVFVSDCKGIECSCSRGYQARANGTKLKNHLISFDYLSFQDRARGRDVLPVGLLKGKIGVAEADGFFILWM